MSEKISHGIYGGILCRKRYIDEKLLEYLHRVDLVVHLGAGFDTWMYRLGTLACMRVLETDLLENIESKRIGVRRVFGAVPGHVTLLAIDFDHEESAAVLAAHDFLGCRSGVLHLGGGHAVSDAACGRGDL
jgi:methyltransferase (TIGR00027 family)